MKLELFHGERRIAVELPEDSGAGTVWVDGIATAASWTRIDGRGYSLVVDGRVFDLSVAFSGDSCTVAGRGGAVELRIVDPRHLESAHEVEPGGAGIVRIRSEMPGKVVRVLVRPGDTVAFGQGLLVLEAMKMQNEITAPRRGTVREVAAVEGRAVASGEFLVSLE
jgi:pyruvate carboxylase subunit B